MPPEAPPIVDVAHIVRLVGAGSFQRGQEYAKAGAVLETEWDAGSRVLSGVVRGSAVLPYRCQLTISNAVPAFSSCNCPVHSDCKHVSALILKSNTDRVKASGLSVPTAKVPEPSTPDWKLAVGEITGSPLRASGQTPAENDGRGIPMALQFELRQQIPRTRGGWNGPVAKPATPPLSTSGAYRLGVRPVVRSAAGKWVRANITWNSLGYQLHRLDLVPEQQSWFAQFSALHRATREPYNSAQEPDWLYLDDFQSSLLWQLFEHASRLGISFVTGKKDGTVTLASYAEVSLDASADDRGLRLTTRLEIDGVEHAVSAAGAIAEHGVYAWAFTPQPQITLAAASRPVTNQLASEVVVPAADVDEFLRDYYPSLQRTFEVTSLDASVQLPEVPPPTLVVTVTFTPKQSLKWSWSWDGFPHPDAEREIFQPVALLLPESSALKGLEAAEFAATTLPQLVELSGVRVEIVGERPDYRELTASPQLRITTVETTKRDWFDLGVYVTVEGRTVPFTPLFKALSKGTNKLLLVDNSYLSLKHPAFDELRRLIAEAGDLAEWETGIRISRYQASLWADFEDLADETEQAQAWRAAVGGLLALDGVDPTPPPASLDAVLRPYQQDGFDWLAFLWRHQLGAILADDMGLGKTLQALALVAHVVEGGSSGARPFLVVAPTSVVSNWVSEAARFTPGLRVQGVTSTRTMIDGDVDIVVTSYALFRLDFDAYQAVEWAGLILDEAQFVKNHATKAHESAVALNTRFKLAITGTPMENSLIDLWSLFQIVAPGLFPSNRRFTEEYVRPITSGADPSLVAKLRRRIRPLMMRRTKDVIATELPAKQEQVLRIDLAPRHRTLYDTFLQKERQKLLGLIDDLDRNRFIVFRSLTLLRILSLDASLVDQAYSDIPSAKLDALFEQLEDVIAEGHRALVFSQFTSFLRLAAARLEAAGIEYEYLDGSTLRRASVIKRFKDGAAPVFLISLKAGGFGLNLTEADYVFLLDPWWNPATETQAVDRTHRIGQTRSVNVYRMVAADTIEEKVMALKEQKARLFDAVMDDDAVFSSALTADDIRGLLEG